MYNNIDKAEILISLIEQNLFGEQFMVDLFGTTPDYEFDSDTEMDTDMSRDPYLKRQILVNINGVDKDSIKKIEADPDYFEKMIKSWAKSYDVDYYYSTFYTDMDGNNVMIVFDEPMQDDAWQAEKYMAAHGKNIGGIKVGDMVKTADGKMGKVEGFWGDKFAQVVINDNTEMILKKDLTKMGGAGADMSYADGGELTSSELDMLNEGFKIKQLKDFLNQKFPDSFGFKVFYPKGRAAELIPDYDRKEPGNNSYGLNGIQDESLKLMFPTSRRSARSRSRGLIYRLYQGGENTYFDFVIVDNEYNEFIGTFGFKDEGDVDKEYITRFVAFLHEAYGYPFSVKHIVAKDGTTIAQKNKIAEVMHEFKEGKLKDRSGKVITNRKQAIAIALSVSRKYYDGGRISEIVPIATEEIDAMSDAQIADYLGIDTAEVNNDYRLDAIFKKAEEIMSMSEPLAADGFFGFGKSQYNTGRSWHLDRARYNKSEKWEKPRAADGKKIDKRSSWHADRRQYNKNEKWEKPLSKRKQVKIKVSTYKYGEFLQDEEIDLMDLPIRQLNAYELSGFDIREKDKDKYFYASDFYIDTDAEGTAVKYAYATKTKYAAHGKDIGDGYNDKFMAISNCDTIHEYAVKLDKMVGEDTELEEWVKMKMTRVEQNVAGVKNALEAISKYDDGGEIFKKQLLHIAKYAVEIKNLINGGTELMSWMEAKLAISAECIDGIYHHLDYEMGNRAKNVGMPSPHRLDKDESGQYAKDGKLIRIPRAEKQKFIDYVYNFYKRKYTLENVRYAVDDYLRSISFDEWGGGDSTDREKTLKFLESWQGYGYGYAEDGMEIADDGFGLLYSRGGKNYIVTADTEDQIELIEMAIMDYRDGLISQEDLENTMQSYMETDEELDLYDIGYSHRGSIVTKNGKPYIYDDFYGGLIELKSSEPIRIDSSEIEFARGGGVGIKFTKESNRLMYFEPVNQRNVIAAYINDSSKIVSPTAPYYLPNPIAKEVIKWSKKNGYKFIQDDKEYARGGGVKKRSLMSMANLVDWKGEGIKKWYMRSYPTDELGEELNDDVTFKDLWDALNNKQDVYEIMGVADSVVRERLFEYLSLVYDVDYDVVYKKWLDSDDYANGGGVDKERLDAILERRTEINNYLNKKYGRSRGKNKAEKDEIDALSKEYRKLGEEYLELNSGYNEYANGGGVGIPNNYEGKTPEQVWNNWTKEQRIHFIQDHDTRKVYNAEEESEFDYDDIHDTAISDWLKEHTYRGQYANGGGFMAARGKELEDWQMSSLWKVGMGKAEKIKTGSHSSIRNFMAKKGDEYLAKGFNLQMWPYNATEKEVLNYVQKPRTATSQQYTKGGGVGSLQEIESLIAKIKKAKYEWYELENDEDKEMFDLFEKYAGLTGVDDLYGLLAFKFSGIKGIKDLDTAKEYVSENGPYEVFDFKKAVKFIEEVISLSKQNPSNSIPRQIQKEMENATSGKTLPADAKYVFVADAWDGWLSDKVPSMKTFKDWGSASMAYKKFLEDSNFNQGEWQMGLYKCEAGNKCKIYVEDNVQKVRGAKKVHEFDYMDSLVDSVSIVGEDKFKIKFEKDEYSNGGGVDNLEIPNISVKSPEKIEKDSWDIVKNKMYKKIMYKVQIVGGDGTLYFDTEKDAKDWYNKIKNFKNMSELYDIYFEQVDNMVKKENPSHKGYKQAPYKSYEIGSVMPFSAFQKIKPKTHLVFTYQNGLKADFIFDKVALDKAIGWLKFDNQWIYGDYIYDYEGNACIGSGANRLTLEKIVAKSGMNLSTGSFKEDSSGNYIDSHGYELINQNDGTYQVLDSSGMDIAGEYETLEQGMQTIKEHKMKTQKKK